MPKFLYDEENTPTPRPTEGEETVEGTMEQPEGKDDIYEEFDFSSFDFTIADPGEISEFSDAPTGEEESTETPPETKEKESVKSTQPKKQKFSLGKLSSAISERAAKLMEETPREPKIREKKEKPQKTPKTPKVPNPSTQELPETETPQKEKIHFTGGTFRQVSRRWLRYALRPGTMYENITELLWPMFLAGVMLFFGGFYLLIGLDWYFADLISMGRLWAIVGIGLLVGGTAATAFAAGAQGLSLICRKERIRPFRVFSSVAGACVYPSVLLILGLLIQLIFKASVSMSFGIMAVLWLMYTLLDVLRDLFGEKNLFKSSLLIILWGFMLFIIMSLTFTLK